MKILIADDSSVVRRIIQDVCQSLSWRLDIKLVSTGTEAHEALLTFDADLAFLDINMPGMNGLEALARARVAGQKIMAVIMSSSDGHALRTAAQELGAYDYLVKPFTANQIGLILADARALLSSHSVLIVDDSRTVRRILVKMIHQLGDGYDVDEAEDAETAIRKMRSGLFDTVLLDLTMPGLSGLEALPLLKAENPSTCVIIVTSHTDPDTVDACRVSGADGFLVKPVRGDRLARLMGVAPAVA
ncbi:MAG: response regulator [Alphaproteobacteria bacterium]|nr:response regulator [Alphaproteobacteria bacterium]